MKTFQENINNETETIHQFINSNKNIRLINIHNEGFSRYDFSFYTIKKQNNTILKQYGVCEAKTRNISSNKYKEEGALLELDKVTALALKIAELKNNKENKNRIIKPYFLCKFTDVILLFDLTNLDLGKIHYKRCPKQSSLDGDNKYIYKPVLMFNKKVAIHQINLNDLK